MAKDTYTLDDDYVVVRDDKGNEKAVRRTDPKKNTRGRKLGNKGTEIPAARARELGLGTKAVSRDADK